jgi:hypothetical protein
MAAVRDSAFELCVAMLGAQGHEDVTHPEWAYFAMERHHCSSASIIVSK